MDVPGEGGPFRISIIIPTRVGWPHMRRSADAILPQLDAVDGELIVVDASGLPAPDFAANSNVRWLSRPGVPSYDLRRVGYALVRAPIVAITEDHCAPRADWAATLLVAHAQAPDAAGIFGLVDNGSRDKVVDWALFSAGYLAWAPPSPALRGAPGHANLSFKTWIFKVMPPVDDQILEFRYVAALREAGYRVVGTDRTLVTHFQSAGLRETATLMFHNGRSIAGLRRTRMTGTDWLRTLVPLPVALYRTLRTWNTAADKPQIEREVRRSVAFICLFHLVHTIGEGVGYLGGPGQSGRRLH